MRKSKFSESKIVTLLKEAQAGRKVSDICREQGISSHYSVSNTLIWQKYRLVLTMIYVFSVYLRVARNAFVSYE